MIRTNLSYLVVGALIGAFLAQHLEKEPLPPVVVSSEKSTTNASNLRLATVKSKKRTKPDGATTELVEAVYVDVEELSNVSKSNSTETPIQNDGLSIYGGAGVDLNLKSPSPRASIMTTHGSWAEQVISNGVNDHSAFIHFKLLTF